jgi:hypothetical protein
MQAVLRGARPAVQCFLTHTATLLLLLLLQ